MMPEKNMLVHVNDAIMMPEKNMLEHVNDAIITKYLFRSPYSQHIAWFIEKLLVHRYKNSKSKILPMHKPI